MAATPPDTLGVAAAKIVASEIAHSTLEEHFARELLTLRRTVASQRERLVDAVRKIEAYAHLEARGSEVRRLALALADGLKVASPAEIKKPNGHRPERYFGHASHLIVTQEDGRFHERPMTPTEVAAIEPAAAIADDIHRHAVYAGVCYIWIWEKIVEAFARFEPTAVEPLLFKPTHRHYKGGLYELLCLGFLEADMSQVAIYRNDAGNVFVRPHKEWAGQVDGKPRFEKIESEASA